jgi:hypothetical protein
MAECNEELPGEMVRATWEGSQAAKRKYVAWIAALDISEGISRKHHTSEPLSTINHNELERAQPSESS